MQFSTSIIISLLGVLSISSHGASLRIEWSGTINSLTESHLDAAPSSISEGMYISGFVEYDTVDAHRKIHILGSHTFGNIYKFQGSVIQEIRIGDLIWRTEGANITFTGYSYESWQAFDVDTRSDRNTVISFPDYAGYARLSFSVWEDSEPLQLFSSTDIDDPQFNFSQFTGAGGRLRTALDNSGSDIDGYDIGFKISLISAISIPEPSSSILLAVGFSSLVLLRKKSLGTNP